jgi:hypothetical protein
MRGRCKGEETRTRDEVQISSTWNRAFAAGRLLSGRHYHKFSKYRARRVSRTSWTMTHGLCIGCCPGPALSTSSSCTAAAAASPLSVRENDGRVTLRTRSAQRTAAQRHRENLREGPREPIAVKFLCSILEVYKSLRTTWDSWEPPEGISKWDSSWGEDALLLIFLVQLRLNGGRAGGTAMVHNDNSRRLHSWIVPRVWPCCPHSAP